MNHSSPIPTAMLPAVKGQQLLDSAWRISFYRHCVKMDRLITRGVEPSLEDCRELIDGRLAFELGAKHPRSAKAVSGLVKYLKTTDNKEVSPIYAQLVLGVAP